MKYYDYDNREFVEFEDRFITQYAEAYYFPESGEISSPLIKGLSRASRYPEKIIDDILKNGIRTEEDIVHILAWKIGKIAHKTCKEDKPFSYSSDWKDLKEYDKWARESSTITLRTNQFPIREIAKCVLKNLNKWEKDIQSGDWFAVLKDLDDEKKQKQWKGIGTVYYITILYFVSRGKYPIFDQFADKALAAICLNEEEFPDANNKKYKSLPSYLPTRQESLKKIKVRYMEYCKRIEKLQEQLSETYRNPQNRDLDRALWVYGHIKSAEDVRKPDNKG